MYQAYAAARGLEARAAVARPVRPRRPQPGHVLVRGDDAWSHLKFEGGPHRVQRVPVTESQGRVHTSSATVPVLPEADEVDVDDRPQRPRRSTCTARRAPAARASTPPTRRCASPTCRPGSSSRCRTSAASCRTGPGRCRCCGPGCSKLPSRSAGGRAVGRAPRTGRRRRPQREDPHLQLQGEPGHRPPHRVHDLPLARRARRRPRRRRRRAGRRRAGPPARRHRLTRDRRVSWRRALDRDARRRSAATPTRPARRAGCARWPRGVDGDEWVLGLDEPATRADGRPPRRHGRPAPAGEPLQYVLGQWAFRRLDLPSTAGCSSRGPRPSWSSRSPSSWPAAMRAAADVVADLGTGSGAIALSLAAELPLDGVDGLGHRCLGRRARRRPGQPGRLGPRGGNVRLAAGRWFDALPVELEGASTSSSATRRTWPTTASSPPGRASGSRPARCSPAPTGSTPVAVVVVRRRWLAGWRPAARLRRGDRSPRHGARTRPPRRALVPADRGRPRRTRVTDLAAARSSPGDVTGYSAGAATASARRSMPQGACAQEVELEQEQVLGHDLLRRHVGDARQRQHLVRPAGGEQRRRQLQRVGGDHVVVGEPVDRAAAAARAGGASASSDDRS